MLEIEDLAGLEEDLLEEGDGDVLGPGVGLGGEVGGGAGSLAEGHHDRFHAEAAVADVSRRDASCDEEALN